MRNKVIKILKTTSFRTVISIILGFFVASIILAICGFNPFECLEVMFNAIFANPKSVVNVILKSAPIAITGLSVAFAFKTGLFNIGVEGQYIVGTIAATIVGNIIEVHPIIHIPLVFLAGTVAGALWACIAGLFKAKIGTHEVLTGIMLNWIALYLCNFVIQLKRFYNSEVNGSFPIKDTAISMLFSKWKYTPQAYEIFKNSQFLKNIVLQTELNLNFLIAVVLAIAIWIVLKKSVIGFELRAVGQNPDASECAGIGVKRNIVLSMLISGALAGLAGALVISGTNNTNYIMTLSVFENYGFNGLAVALIAGSSPIGCIFSSLFFSSLLYSGKNLQSEIGAPNEIIHIIIGIIIFFVALAEIIPRFINMFDKKGVKKC